MKKFVANVQNCFNIQIVGFVQNLLKMQNNQSTQSQRTTSHLAAHFNHKINFREYTKMSKANTVPAESNVTAISAKPKFKVTRNVTLPLLKMVLETPIYVQFDGAMYVGKEVKGEGAKQKEEPAILAHIVNLETGEKMQLIISAVVKENLKDCYPDDSYVGKQFELIKHDKREGKRYFDFSITEIEME